MNLKALIILLATLIPAQSLAEKLPLVRSQHQAGAITVEMVDLSPRFLRFFDRALTENPDPDGRWSLWREEYGFAAVPPTAEGWAMARRILDDAWPKYGKDIPLLRQGAGRLWPRIEATIADVVRVLGYQDSGHIRVVTYVGGYDGNAFVAGDNGTPAVNIPLEIAPEELDPLLRHELTHAVHMMVARLPGTWERSVAQLILEEGLAMRSVEAQLPGRPASYYIEHRPGWLVEVTGRLDSILEGLQDVLPRKDSDAVHRVTMGNGFSGIDREAYAAGWFVVGHLQQQGISLAEIARIPEYRMVEVVGQAIEDLRRNRNGGPGSPMRDQ